MFRPMRNTIGYRDRREVQRMQEQSPDLSELCQGVGVIEGRSVFVISEEGVDAKLPTPVIIDSNVKLGGRSRRSKAEKREKWKKPDRILKEKEPHRAPAPTHAMTSPPILPDGSYRPAYVIWRFLGTQEKQTIIGNSLGDADLKYLQDYFNFQKKGFYLPPLHQQPWPSEGVPQRTVRAHKTYTTRKGALLLYAEDLAHSFPSKRKKKRKKSFEAEDGPSLNTMNELRSAILSYGAKEQDEKVFMGFTNAKTNKFNSTRSVQPGYSAKRYLANWSKSWDDSILNYLRSEGHLLDKTIFAGSPVVPMYRRMNDDISDVPKPYTVNREMFISATQDRVAYEFYRIRPDDMEYGSGESPDFSLQPHPPTRAPESSRLAHSGMIATIARDADQVPHPVVYSQLHPEDQQRVLKKLILQSAAHHSPERGMPEDMEEAIVNLVTENSKSILSGGGAFVMEDNIAEERRTESTLSSNSWPDGIQNSGYDQVASQLSSVPTLPPINIPGLQTGENQRERPLSEKGDVTLPDINQGPGLVHQSSPDSTRKLMETGEKAQVTLPAVGDSLAPGLKEEAGEGSHCCEEAIQSGHEKAASVKSSMSLEEKDGGLSITSQLSHSLDDLFLANEQQDAMKGGVIPKNRTESMRSYKGGKIRSGASSRASSITGEEELSVVGSLISLPSEERGELCAEDGTHGPVQDKATEAMQRGTEDAALPGIGSPPPSLDNTVQGSATLPEMNGLVSHKTSDGEGQRVTDTQDAGNESSLKEHHGTNQRSSDNESNSAPDTRVAKVTIPTTDDLSREPLTDGMSPITAGIAEDGKGMALPPDHKGPTDEVTGADDDDLDYGSSVLKDSADSIPAEYPDGQVNSQPLPTALIGSDLTEEAVRRHSEDFPKPKKRLSMSSTGSTPHSLRSVPDEGEGSLTASELFNNFSYARRKDSEQGSCPSRKVSLQSSLASDGDEAEIGGSAEDSATSWADDEMTNHGESGLQGESASSLGEPLTGADVGEDPTEAREGNDSSALQGEQSGDDDVRVREDEIADHKMSRNTSSGALSLMSQLEEEAAAIAETVVQGARPRSRRDLTEDAQLAVALWKERLGELFQNQEPSDETQSLILRHRRNSLDGSSVASLDLGKWEGPETRRSHRSRRQRRVTSAEPKVEMNDHSLAADAIGNVLHPGSVPAQVVPPVDDGEQEPQPSAQGLTEDEKQVPQDTPIVSGGDALILDNEKNILDLERREIEDAEDSYLQKIIADAGLLPETSVPSDASKKSKVSPKNSKSEKSEKSSSRKSSIKSEKPDADKIKEFVVGLPHDDKVDYLADPQPSDQTTVMKIGTDPGKPKTIVPKPPKKPKKEKTKKDKMKKAKKPTTKQSPPEEDKPEKPTSDQPESVAETIKGNPEVTQEEEGENKSAESPEFIIIHEEFSDSEPEIQPQQLTTDDEFLSSSLLDSQDEGPSMSDFGTEDTEDNSSQGPGSLSRSQARAARRAAESERKKREVEQKRQAKEDARRKAQEEQERKERIKMEFEEERRRKEEDLRLKHEAEEAALRLAEESEEERRRRDELVAERERKQQEEYKRKLEVLAKQKKEEEKQRMELEAQRQKEEAERQAEEAERVARMAEEERQEYERRKQEEALIARIRAEEERMRREVESQLAREEAQRLALEIARRQREMEKRLNFNRELNSEANVLSHSQEVSRAFTWSYFELLDYLGIPIPENLKEKYLKGQLLPTNHHSADAPSD